LCEKAQDAAPIVNDSHNALRPCQAWEELLSWASYVELRRHRGGRTSVAVDLEDDMLSNSLIELDRAHLIHPVSAYRSHEATGVRVLKSGKGATLTDVSGRQLLDGFAGLW
jgi:hypothetical protein